MKDLDDLFRKANVANTEAGRIAEEFGVDSFEHREALNRRDQAFAAWRAEKQRQDKAKEAA